MLYSLDKFTFWFILVHLKEVLIIIWLIMSVECYLCLNSICMLKSSYQEYRNTFLMNVVLTSLHFEILNWIIWFVSFICWISKFQILFKQRVVLKCIFNQFVSYSQNYPNWMVLTQFDEPPLVGRAHGDNIDQLRVEYVHVMHEAVTSSV